MYRILMCSAARLMFLLQHPKHPKEQLVAHLEKAQAEIMLTK